MRSGATNVPASGGRAGSWIADTIRGRANKLKLALVCGGGGAKALACAGAWRAIAEAGHQVVQLVGTSLGAVVAAAFAAGGAPRRPGWPGASGPPAENAAL